MSSSNKNSDENNSISFEDLDLREEIQKALKDVGYTSPSPIQAAMIPHLLQGRDVLGQAQTGTGKTAAFALPLLSGLDEYQKTPQILVLAPTRELAGQVAENFAGYSKYMKNVHILPIYGGQDYKIQLNALRRGVQVVVGTPGRVIDHIKRGSLDITQLQALVLDEADEMLRMGFIDDVEWILGHTPEQRQVALFSATMPPQIHKIARTYLNDPEEIHIKVKAHTPQNIRQRMLVTSNGHQKQESLNMILEAEPTDGVIIFARTRNSTTDIARDLKEHGYKCAALNGDMMQRERERTVEQLKNGSLDILIATDVAARGLDVERISHVINYDIPTDDEVYIHRIGRTGRAGRSGDAILFVKPGERRRLHSIERTTKAKIEKMAMPSIDDINQIRIEKFKKNIDYTLTGGAQKSKDYELFKKILNDYSTENDIDLIDIAAAMAKIAQGNTPLLRNPLTKAQRQERQRANEGGRGGRERSGGRDRNERRGGRERDGRRGDGRRDSRANDRPNRAPRELEAGMERYRIDLGRNNDVKPGSIVGAIAGETGMDGGAIGQINIQQDHSFVDLPTGLPQDILKRLHKTRIGGDRINIKSVEGGASGAENSWSPNNDDIQFDAPRRKRKKERHQPRNRGGQKSFERKGRDDRFKDDGFKGERGRRKEGSPKRDDRNAQRSEQRDFDKNSTDKRPKRRDNNKAAYKPAKQDNYKSDNQRKSTPKGKKANFSKEGALRAAKSFKATSGKAGSGKAIKGKVMRGKISRKT